MINVSKEQIIQASQITDSAPKAAKLLGISYNTYKNMRKHLDVLRSIIELM